MTVLIAGAGIGGLTLALSLQQVGVPFRIFEAMHRIRPLGVGICLQPNAVREFADLGLGEKLEARGLPIDELCYLTRHGQTIWSQTRGRDAGYHWPQYAMHRGTLQMLLAETLTRRCGGDVVETGRVVAGWRDGPEGVELRFAASAGGNTEGGVHGRVLVAADGVNSVLRRLLYPDEGGPRWNGNMLWRGVSPAASGPGTRRMLVAGDRRRKIVTYPVPDRAGTGTMVNWIASLRVADDHPPKPQNWHRRGRAEDFLPAFRDWVFDGLDVPAMVGAAKRIFEYPEIDRDPLPQWSFGRVTMIGDAAHAMYPNGTNGASQSILDARYLARELRDKGGGAAALDSYDLLRREVVNALLLMNRKDGPDRILDIVAERAPDGFEDIAQVMPEAELRAFADRYRRVEGAEIRGLNAASPLIGPAEPPAPARGEPARRSGFDPGA
ncbi:flavin-dependent oxidoreductase [Shimia sp.]|uniref:flavin-dependent oxidoreductase n=1 Tax=Shimia sp. TaxID=1954381 RepID=UPI003565BA74